MIQSVSFNRLMPNQVRKDESFVVYTVLTLSRNMAGYDLPMRLEDKQKKEINSRVKEFLNTLPDYENITDITSITSKDNELLGLIDREILDYEIIKFLGGKSRNVRIYLENRAKYSITTNVYDHFYLRTTYLGNGIDEVFDTVERMSILFDEYFVPSFNKSYGYITSDISTIGHGVKMKFLLNIWGLRNSNNLENIIDTLSSNGVYYNHNPLYDRTNFMEFSFAFQPDKSMIANKIMFKSLIERVREIEIKERMKLGDKFSTFNIVKDYNDFKTTVKSANFIHYKAFVNIISKLSIVSFLSSLRDKEIVDLSELINFLLVFLRDASIMLHSNIPPTESFIGRERANMLKKFFNISK
ncbi:MAG: hypothetical protein N2712_05345 [Brevinematales bacterium]|nr:hypothetical protein [Brevinematales bacterium]